MNNPFQYSSTQYTHLSVGAVIVNKAGEVLCHYWKKTPMWDLKDLYILMRESLEPGEPLETAIARGMLEEFGATGELQRYLGAIISHFPEEKFGPDAIIEKTTIYFLVKFTDIDESKRAPGDLESQSELQWHKPELLIPKMKEQAKQAPQRTDINESIILEKLINEK